MARAWHLVSRPQGVPTAANFELRDLPSAPLSAGMIRVRNTYLSVDPYMRPRMDDVSSYIAPFELDEPLTGGAVGIVVESRHPNFTVGNKVSHALGWRDEAVLDGVTATLLPAGHSDEHFLNELGMIGATAYFGLLDVGHARPGDTLFVSAGAGAVGSLVIQIAKLRGMRVIASAGGAAKCRVVTDLGADAAIDYKSPGSIEDKLRDAAPDGIDVYFDNVGGSHLDAAMGVAKQGAHIAVCGMIDMYNSDAPVALANLFSVISKRLTMRGFIVSDYENRMREFHAEMSAWLRAGMIRSNNSIFDSLESTPEAFLSLFSGGNVGKVLIRV